MRLVLALVAAAITLVFVGGVGWVAAAVAEAPSVRMVFQWTLLGGVAVTFGALGAAALVGLWHLYLRLFTGRKPRSRFATTSRDDE